MDKFIIVRTQFEGFHCWSDAPEEVKFLRDTHRHLFNVELRISVDHNDRELEFFMVKKRLDNIIKWYIELNGTNLGSCEMMGESFIKELTELYGNRYYQIKIFEDNENGGEVVKEKIIC